MKIICHHSPFTEHSKPWLSLSEQCIQRDINLTVDAAHTYLGMKACTGLFLGLVCWNLLKLSTKSSSFRRWTGCVLRRVLILVRKFWDAFLVLFLGMLHLLLVPMQSATSGTISALSNITAQKLISNQPINWRRALAMSVSHLSSLRILSSDSPGCAMLEYNR